jgi:DNA modification methylase
MALPLDDAILADLRDPSNLSYEAIGARHGVSRGKVWSVAVEHKARKNEARIMERAAERRQRRKETLLELVNATKTADVLDFFDGLPDEAVQLHATSIPYNLGKSYLGNPDLDRHRHTFYLGWILQVLSEMDRTLAQGGVIFLQVGSTKDDGGARYPLDILLFEYLRNMGLTYQSRVVWRIPHGLTPKKRLAERYETALVFSKGEPKCFNASAARIPQKDPGKRAFKGPHLGELSGSPLGAWPVDVWEIPNVGHNHPEQTGHPAQFPEELVRRAVLLWSMPGDLVCDPFMGSGTTAAAAKRTHRSFVGCDLAYEDLRAKRLAAVDPDLACALPGVTPESVAVWQAEAHPVRVPCSLEDFAETSA